MRRIYFLFLLLDIILKIFRLLIHDASKTLKALILFLDITQHTIYKYMVFPINSMEFLSNRKARKFIFNLTKMRNNSNYYLQCKITYRCIKNTVKIIGIKKNPLSSSVLQYFAFSMLISMLTIFFLQILLLSILFWRHSLPNFKRLPV